jgi:hypothetical protein
MPRSKGAKAGGVDSNVVPVKTTKGPPTMRGGQLVTEEDAAAVRAQAEGYKRASEERGAVELGEGIVSRRGRALRPRRGVPKGELAPLLPQQELFVKEYLTRAHRSAAVAARLAGYGNNKDVHRAAGYSLIHQPKIKAAIARAMEATRMETEEAMARLGVAARGVGAYLRADETGYLTLDVKQMLEDGNGDLIVEISDNGRGQTVKFANPQEAQKFIASVGMKVETGFGARNNQPTARVDVDLNVVFKSVADILTERAGLTIDAEKSPDEYTDVD